MELHGGLADHQPPSDLAVGHAHREQAQHLVLPLGEGRGAEAADRQRVVAHHVGDHGRRPPRVEHALPAQEGLHGAGDVGDVGALAQVAVHAEADGAHHDVAVAAAGEHEHPHTAVALQQHPHQLDARRVAAAEVDVEDHEIGRAAVGDHQRVARARRLADHGDLRVGGEQLAQSESDDRLGVDDEQPRGAAGDGGAVQHGVSRHGGLLNECALRVRRVTLPRRCTVEHLGGLPLRHAHAKMAGSRER